MGVVTWKTSEVVDGDFRIDLDADRLVPQRLGFAAGAWVWLRQVHGADVVAVDRSTAAARCGTRADALVTADDGVVLAIHTADCAPVILTSDVGVIGLAHAGWRGVEAGVVQATAATMRSMGATALTARIGPCIGASCYEFSESDLDRLASRFGPLVRSETSWGSPALDLVQAVRSAAAEASVELDVGGADGPPCTACEPSRFFSYRARADTARMATIITRAGRRDPT